MQQTFGKFQENFSGDREFLNIGFSPSSLSIQQRWRNNGLSADFVADYLTTFFPYDSDSEREKQRQAEIKHAVSYIANELLENAMKFNYFQSQQAIEFGIHLLGDREFKIVLYVSNSVDPDRVKEFQAFIQELLTSDPNELFILQMEKNAENPDSEASRLGFLTMINDYAAELGWNFTTQSNPEQSILVTTMVWLTV